jgi:shikimate kinase
MNITLIGMSGVGKTRIGSLLSAQLGYRFIDIDRIIENNNSKTLQQLIDDSGTKKFLEMEEKAILSITDTDNIVISPGGSAIYSEKAMNFLKSISTVVFLDATLDEIKRRTADFSDRGIVGLKEKGLETLFAERLPLYRKYADITIDVEGFSDEQIVDGLTEAILH